MVGTVDSWLLWKLTGNHVTDVSNASRTMLFNINSLEWDDDLCSFFGIPISALPKVCSSAEIYGNLNASKLNGIPISGILGDQQELVLDRCTFELIKSVLWFIQLFVGARYISLNIFNVLKPSKDINGPQH